MLARPLWVIAGLTYAAWVTGVALFWASPFPISPLRVLAVVVTFYAPALWIGPWATSQGRVSPWTWRDLILASVVTCLLYAPLGILTLPVSLLTVGSVGTSLVLLGRGLVWLPKHHTAVAV
jgi:hypothetical protein